MIFTDFYTSSIKGSNITSSVTLELVLVYITYILL